MKYSIERDIIASIYLHQSGKSIICSFAVLYKDSIIPQTRGQVQETLANSIHKRPFSRKSLQIGGMDFMNFMQILDIAKEGRHIVHLYEGLLVPFSSASGRRRIERTTATAIATARATDIAVGRAPFVV